MPLQNRITSETNRIACKHVDSLTSTSAELKNGEEKKTSFLLPYQRAMPRSFSIEMMKLLIGNRVVKCFVFKFKSKKNHAQDNKVFHIKDFNLMFKLDFHPYNMQPQNDARAITSFCVCTLAFSCGSFALRFITHKNFFAVSCPFRNNFFS